MSINGCRIDNTNKTNPLISIIMPAYNADLYISECLQAILDQTYANWELFIINDGSTDQTLSICNRYSLTDSRIHVIDQEHRGVSYSRNTGLDNVSGELIVFVDADDIIPPDSLKIRYELISDAEMGLAAYELFSDEKGVIDRMPYCTQSVLDQHTVLNSIIFTGKLGYQGYTVNKIFRRDIIDKQCIRFDESVFLNEDRLFCVRYALECNKVYTSNDLVYKYRRSQQTATSSVKYMTDRDYNYFVSEFFSFDQILALLKDSDEYCYYWAAVEAQYRAVLLNKIVKRTEKELIKELNRRNAFYGSIALKAPASIIGYRKKLKVLGHMVL